MILSRLRDFSEWGQCQIMELLKRYQPASEEEVFDLLVSGDQQQRVAVLPLICALGPSPHPQ